MVLGPGRWKLNVSILADEDFDGIVRDFWANWKLRKNCFPSLLLWWDSGKKHLKELAKSFCRQKSRDKRQARVLLSNLASHLKERVDRGFTSCLDVYQAVLAKLSELALSEAKGAQVRSRVRWAEEGETSSSFFFRLEKKRAVENTFFALLDDNDLVVTSNFDIISSWVSFYSSLFTKCDVDPVVQASLLSKVSDKVPMHQAEQCEGALTAEEVFLALNGMALNKSPGSDGLPVEFYLKFWKYLGKDLVEVFNFAFSSGGLSPSQRTGLITLLYKKGDRLERRNWRPVTLLNVDYKLCARALAGRLLKVIHLVTAPDQTCGVPGRFIGENVAFVRDVAHLATELDWPVAILSLDQEKAFDRVDWSFLFSTLGVMGFGPSFISWIKLLYSNIRSAILVNNFRSPYCFPSRGVRQGCPLSPLLYVLTMEVLAVNIRCHSDIRGIPLLGHGILPVLSLYADDTSVVVTSDKAVAAVFKVYSDFEKGTGSKINLDKCEGLWLGSWRNRLSGPVANRWTSTRIKVLGVFIGFGSLDEENWRPRIEAVDKCLASWRSRSLSYEGKAIVVNALALSRLWYVGSLVPIPDWALAELNSLVFKFFWSGKKDLVSRQVVIQPKSVGGFGLVSVALKIYALLIQWVRRLLDPRGAWASLLSFWCSLRFGSNPLSMLSRPTGASFDRLPPFYKSVFDAWKFAGGYFSPRLNGLVVGFGSESCALVSSATVKSVYSFLLSACAATPHCVLKFRPVFGELYWPATWRQLSFCPLDRKVIDFCWKVAHGVPYTAERLVSFGYAIQPACFCGHQLESLSHLLFECPLAQSGISWIQSLLFLASPLAPPITIRHVLFGFHPDELAAVPRVFVYLLHVCKYLIWWQRNDYRFRSVRPSAAGLIATIKARARFYIPLLFKRFRSSRRRRYFLRQWGANGVVCSVDNGSLAFHL